MGCYVEKSFGSGHLFVAHYNILTSILCNHHTFTTLHQHSPHPSSTITAPRRHDWKVSAPPTAALHSEPSYIPAGTARLGASPMTLGCLSRRPRNSRKAPRPRSTGCAARAFETAPRSAAFASLRAPALPFLVVCCCRCSACAFEVHGLVWLHTPPSPISLTFPAPRTTPAMSAHDQHPETAVAIAQSEVFMFGLLFG